jgi:ribosome-associated heat shock protein Hsp15
MSASQPTLLDVRIDKWLWAARFFKTRSLATDAIDAGHVRRGSVGSISGDRVKAALIVKVGDAFAVRRGDSVQEIVVLAVSDRRGSASDAALLYKETESSVAIRLDRQMARAAANGQSGQPILRGRPTKQDRRKLAQLFASTFSGQSDTASLD